MLHNKQYQPQYPLDAICFDCDNTLSLTEGIDELALLNGVRPQVKALTELAMGHDDISPDLYRKRLELTQPTQSQFDILTSLYLQNIPDDLQTVVDIFLSLGKALFVLSAGNDPAVSSFAAQLGFPASNVFAVSVYFDNNGDYLDFDRHNPMTKRAGKSIIIQKIKKRFPHILHIGDGNNDLAVLPYVDRFIGYGGGVIRDSIKQASHAYIECPSFLPLLPLALHHDEIATLSEEQHQAYQQGLNLFADHVALSSTTNPRESNQ